jgi:hypothetical protein
VRPIVCDRSFKKQSLSRGRIARNNYLDIFPALPTNIGNLRPLVVAIHESDGGEPLLILSPPALPKRSPTMVNQEERSRLYNKHQLVGETLMKISHPNAQNPTPEESRALEQLKAIIERATADGKISRQELDSIKAAQFADGKISIAELELYRTLILEKVEKGELEYEW